MVTNIQTYQFSVQDNPVGSGTGKFRDQRLFTARQNHASLVPILGLIKHEDFNALSGLSLCIIENFNIKTYLIFTFDKLKKKKYSGSMKIVMHFLVCSFVDLLKEVYVKYNLQ